MKIYIPKRLLEIPIIDQFSKMITYYSDNIESEEDFPFLGYNNSQKLDPVKEFIDICLSVQNYPENQDVENISNYLVKLFYSVKGTVKVFEYMEKYLGITFVGDVRYTTELVDFSIKDVLVEDEDLFNQLLSGFLSSLLYYNNLGISSSTSDLVIRGVIENSANGKIIQYNIITTTLYEN